MLYKVKVVVCFEIRTNKHKKECEGLVEFFNVKAGGTK